VGDQGPAGLAPGADDNASGTAALLEVARTFAESGLRPAETILFVAFAGYARITVLGEEVRDPARTIPRAMIASFAIIIVIYVVLGHAVLRAAAEGVALSAAPLESIAAAVGPDALQTTVRIAAVIAAGAVLLSLLAGIGRTLFAMGRGGDAPSALAAITPRTAVPARAEILAAGLALVVVLIGGIAYALALSAVTILTYYAVAHLAVLARVRKRQASPALAAVAAFGLLGCAAVVTGLFLAATTR
jgi:APA family basic amino acid/polyamine antiporter